MKMGFTDREFIMNKMAKCLQIHFAVVLLH